MADFTYTNLNQTLKEFFEDQKKENVTMDLLKSKKFQASLVGLIVAIVAEIGLALDPVALLAVLSPILTYIGGQALADIGKEKAKAQNRRL